MTQTLRIAMAQFDFPVGAVAQNSESIRRMIAEARDEYGADVVLFPELAVSGYPPEDLLLREHTGAGWRGVLNEVLDRLVGDDHFVEADIEPLAQPGECLSLVGNIRQHIEIPSTRIDDACAMSGTGEQALKFQDFL